MWFDLSVGGYGGSDDLFHGPTRMDGPAFDDGGRRRHQGKGGRWPTRPNGPAGCHRIDRRPPCIRHSVHHAPPPRLPTQESSQTSTHHPSDIDRSTAPTHLCPARRRPPRPRSPWPWSPRASGASPRRRRSPRRVTACTWLLYCGRCGRERGGCYGYARRPAAWMMRWGVGGGRDGCVKPLPAAAADFLCVGAVEREGQGWIGGPAWGGSGRLRKLCVLLLWEAASDGNDRFSISRSCKRTSERRTHTRRPIEQSTLDTGAFFCTPKMLTRDRHTPFHSSTGARRGVAGFRSTAAAAASCASFVGIAQAAAALAERRDPSTRGQAPRRRPIHLGIN